MTKSKLEADCHLSGGGSPPHQSFQETLQWFGSIITQPISRRSELPKMTPSGRTLQQEAGEWILQSSTLLPAERIEIYAQQYWWRLLGCLQKAFPLVTRLVGYQRFNEKLATPYLVKYPSNHWSLSHLGERFPKWAAETGQEQLVVSAIEIDWAFEAAFIAGKGDRVLEDVKEITLAPHVFLFQFSENLFDFRRKVLKEKPSFWQEHPLPKRKKGDFFFILWQNERCAVETDCVDRDEWIALKWFERGGSIDGICEWIGCQGEVFQEIVEKNLQNWFQKWVSKGWIVQKGCYTHHVSRFGNFLRRIFPLGSGLEAEINLEESC